MTKIKTVLYKKCPHFYKLEFKFLKNIKKFELFLFHDTNKLSTETVDNQVDKLNLIAYLLCKIKLVNFCTVCFLIYLIESERYFLKAIFQISKQDAAEIIFAPLVKVPNSVNPNY